MRIDKFGLGSLIIGLAIVVVLLQAYFMGSGWTLAGLWNAVSVMAVGGALLLGVFLFLIGVLLLVL
jgi:hypothetical protein